MAHPYKVILTGEGLRDLEEIAEYITEHSPGSAAIVAERILAAIDSLGSMPRRFRQAGVSRRRRSPVHSMVVRPFIVYYRVEEHPAAVYVLHIRHGRRRQPRRFE